MRECTYDIAPDDPSARDSLPVSLPNLQSLNTSDYVETMLYLDAPLLSPFPSSVFVTTRLSVIVGFGLPHRRPQPLSEGH